MFDVLDLCFLKFLRITLIHEEAGTDNNIRFIKTRIEIHDNAIPAVVADKNIRAIAEDKKWKIVFRNKFLNFDYIINSSRLDKNFRRAPDTECAKWSKRSVLCNASGNV